VLCLAIILTTLAFGTVHTWSLALFAASAALVVVLWAVDAWLTRSLRVSLNPLQLPLLGFFALGLVQCFRSRARGPARRSRPSP
jgi:hypothetical protein